MSIKLLKTVILKQTSWCISRKEEVSYFIYNSKSDEMHLIPPTGYYIYQLCDGLRSISEIIEIFESSMNNNKEVISTKVCEFLKELIEREILEFENDK